MCAFSIDRVLRGIIYLSLGLAHMYAAHYDASSSSLPWSDATVLGVPEDLSSPVKTRLRLF